MEGFKFTEVEDVFSCHRCTVAFSLDQYKYHCRFCDKVCCGDCTTLLENARVCYDCFECEDELPVENQEIQPEASGTTDEFEDDWEDQDKNEVLGEHQTSRLEATAPVEDEASNRQDICTVCYENPIDSALVQCGHMCMCYECSLIVKGPSQNNSGPCPICREPIEKVLRIFK